MHPITVQQQSELPPCGFSELLQESEAADLRLVRRLVDDWHSGENRFDQLGEALFVATAGSQIVGVCGLNRDPFTSLPDVGRVRHLYVLSEFRRLGVGRRLVDAIMQAARARFSILRLRTNHASAAQFYLALGFHPVVGVEACTHELRLDSQ